MCSHHPLPGKALESPMLKRWLLIALLLRRTIQNLLPAEVIGDAGYVVQPTVSDVVEALNRSLTGETLLHHAKKASRTV